MGQEVPIRDTPTWTTPDAVVAITGAIGDAVQIVVKSLSTALTTIFTTGGILIVLILAGLGFMFVYWAIRLIHLRGR